MAEDCHVRTGTVNRSLFHDAKVGNRLGLSIVRKIMEDHEGRVELSDGVLGGAMARLVLSRKLNASAKRRLSALRNIAKRHMALDILIVDDEADIRRLIAGILEDEGFESREAGDSAEAFEAIRKRQPNLIILDVWLQGSEYDGLQILELVRKENPNQQVIMISGHATFDMAVSATKIGVTIS